jgi:Na+-driven multidrug efflux pump
VALERCSLRVTGRGALRAISNLAAPTAFLAVRTGALTATYAVATALTVRAGAEVAAANSLCLQLWLSSSLLSDALAVAAQSLVARSLAAGRPAEARQVVRRTAALALGLGVLLASLLALGAGPLPRVFSSDPAVLGLSRGVWAFVVFTQPPTAAAFVYDGVLFGAPNGFRFAAVSMAASCAPAVVLMQAMLAASSSSGGGTADGAATLSAVWAGLAVLMALRWLTIALPYKLRVGPFAAFKDTTPPPEGGG